MSMMFSVAIAAAALLSHANAGRMHIPCKRCNHLVLELKTVHRRREVVYKPAQVVGEKYIRPAGKGNKLQMTPKPLQQSECSASEQVHITLGDTYDHNPSILISFASANVLSGVHFGEDPEKLTNFYAADAKTFTTIYFFTGNMYAPQLGKPYRTPEELGQQLDTASFGKTAYLHA